MHHPCPQCGAVVADTQPFCGHCRAPQIRMGGSAEPDANMPTAPPPLPSAPKVEETNKIHAQTELLPQPPRMERSGMEQPPVALSKAPIQWSYTLPRLGVIGLGTMLCMTLVPIPILNLLFVPLGCVVAVWFHARKTAPLLPTKGQGAI